VELLCGDEGVWAVPEEVELLAVRKDGKKVCVARWVPEFGATRPNGEKQIFGNMLGMQLRWCGTER
jgi:hypothetical protein